MDVNQPRRRGRRPNAIVAGQHRPEVDQNETQVAGDAPAKRRRRSPVGGMQLKLSAPPRPGFVRRWFNDEGNRIAQAEELAYDFVTDPNVQSASSDTRISRLVGTKANGEPLRAFLMETPEAEYAVGIAEKDVLPRQIDEAIAAGRDSTGQMPPSSEVYGHGSIDRR